MLEVARVLGEGLARVAATLRPLVRETFLEPGIGEQELSERYAVAGSELGPQLGILMQHILNMHLRDQLRTDVVDRAELARGGVLGAVRMSIAFADLVGFTKLGERVPAEELGAVARRLIELTGDVTGAHPAVRLVKTIGDAAMLVSADPDALLESALALVAAADAEGEEFPRLRAGIATGPVLGARRRLVRQPGQPRQPHHRHRPPGHGRRRRRDARHGAGRVAVVAAAEPAPEGRRPPRAALPRARSCGPT